MNESPDIPEHNFKLRASYHLSERLNSSVDMLVNSGQYLRGDETNLDDETDTYAVANAALSYRLSDHLSLTVQVKNLFDKGYQTFGLYGETAEVMDNRDAEEARFLSPGVPGIFWLGLKLRC